MVENKIIGHETEESVIRNMTEHISSKEYGEHLVTSILKKLKSKGENTTLLRSLDFL